MADIFENKEFLISAIASVISDGDSPAAPDELDEALICRLAARNNIGTILYFADKKGNFLSPETAQKLEKSYKAGVVRELNQQAELEKLRSDFAENNIDFMLLKGSHLKSLYPMPEMRFMVDMDILVRASDVERAKELILASGLELKMNNGKDLVFIKEPFLTVELHNTLFIEENSMYSYFLSVWDRAEKLTEREYKMSDNDLYVYTLAHLCEHYVSAEACLRPVMDIYLLNKKLSDKLDFDYINAQLEILGILKFAENIKSLGKCMFEGAEKDETLLMMENYVMLGSPVKDAYSALNADKSKLSRIISSAFPKLSHMKKLYPKLEKYPFLIVFYWLKRIFANIFKPRTKEKLNAIQGTGEKEYDVLHDIFRKSGLE